MCDQLLLRAVIYFNNIKILKIFNFSGQINDIEIYFSAVLQSFEMALTYF